jgi:hypothetical protein
MMKLNPIQDGKQVPSERRQFNVKLAVNSKLRQKRKFFEFKDGP